MSTVYFHKEDTDFQITRGKSYVSWIKEVIILEKFLIGNLNFIFCSDSYLLKINKEHLNHNTFTDIITFNYNVDKLIAGDIFISIDRIKENSSSLKVPFDTELKRVIIHGVLHLIGYNDKTAEEVEIMRAKEDFYITLFN